MKENNRFNKMINENLNESSSFRSEKRKMDREVKHELREEQKRLKQAEKEAKRLAKLNKNNVNPSPVYDLSNPQAENQNQELEPITSESEPKVEPISQTIENEPQTETNGPSEVSAANIQKVDKDELERLRAEIKRENGEEDLVINTHYKRQTDDEEESYSESSDEGEDETLSDETDENKNKSEENTQSSSNEQNETERLGEAENSIEENNEKIDANVESSASSEIQAVKENQNATLEKTSEEPAKEETSEEKVNEESVINDNSLPSEQDSSVSEELSDQESSTEEVTYREKEEIDNRLKSNDNISRVNEDEIARLKREIALERGIISADDIVECEQKNAKTPYKSVKNDVKTPKTEEKVENDESETTEQSNTNEPSNVETQATENGQIPQASNGFQTHTLEIIDNDDKSDTEEIADNVKPPDVSQQDNITDQEIQQLLAEQEKQAREAELQEEEEIYEGMTEEEIADAKERKRKFAELKIRYNAKDIDVNGDIGDYKKNLDFSVNTSIKRFKVAPPKKPFIIAGAILGVLIIIAGLITYFALNTPPPPVVLTSVRLSQDVTTQYVGELVDFTGVYAIKTYSDDSTENVDLVSTMVTDRSNNITSDLRITSYSNDTKITLNVSGFELELKISLTQIDGKSVDAKILNNNLKVGDTLRFEDILLLVNVQYSQGEIILNETDQIMFDPKNAVLLVSDQELIKTESGFVLDQENLIEGENTIKIVIEFNGVELTTEVSLTLLGQK